MEFFGGKENRLRRRQGFAVAGAVVKAFNCSVNELPFSLVISWFEQKAVAVLLTLRSLGIKGITLGPNPPAFVSPGVFEILQEKFDLKLTPTNGRSPVGEIRLPVSQN